MDTNEGADHTICNRWPPRGVSNEFRGIIFHLDPTDREGLRGESEMQLLTPNQATFICLPSIHGILGVSGTTSEEYGTWMADMWTRKERISIL